MAKCPNCKKEIEQTQKTWKYGNFTVNAYSCKDCNTQFREYYDKNGKHSFTLKLERGKGYIKAS
jgi:DNA-directed RNA polymerase subunit RPC12/RpoP